MWINVGKLFFARNFQIQINLNVFAEGYSVINQMNEYDKQKITQNKREANQIVKKITTMDEYIVRWFSFV